MKKSHIIAITVIAVAVAIIVSTTGDAGSYLTFQEAKVMSDQENFKEVHVVGTLKKDTEGEVLGIMPSKDKLSFSFLMVDQNGTEQVVYYNEPMPADFLRSEQVVVIGKYAPESVFVADKILMKCPSKYQEETVEASL
jgi:cytochrome c-type biogenesis protein CcmE